MRRSSVVMFLIVLLLIFPSLVFAVEYENDYGLELTQEEYTNLRKLYTEKYIDTMSPSEYAYIESLNLNYNTLQKTTKYIKSVTNTITGTTTDYEISETEYNNLDSGIAPAASYIETQYKQLSIIVGKISQTSAYATVDLVWKVAPSVRSYDVIGMRLSNFGIINGSQYGRQIYTASGNTSYVNYNYNGSNINNLSNGFGISMNLVDQNITYLECTVSANLATYGYPATVFGSYQHATSDITLAKSKSYSLASGGLGSVFSFTNNYGNYYDGMQGVYDGFNS